MKKTLMFDVDYQRLKRPKDFWNMIGREGQKTENMMSPVGIAAAVST